MPTRINPYKCFHGSLVPNWLMPRKEISPGAKLCYGRLAQYAGKKAVAYPRQRVLAEELGVSDRQIRSYIRELAYPPLHPDGMRDYAPLIEVVQLGLKKANRYFFLDHPWIQEGQQRAKGPDRKPKGSSAQERSNMSAPERIFYSTHDRQATSETNRLKPSAPLEKTQEEVDSKEKIIPPPSPKGDAAGAVLSLWNSLIGKDENPVSLTRRRSELLHQRLKESHFAANWRQAIERLSKCIAAPCNGGLRCLRSFDWFIKSDSDALVKILEGIFDPRAKTESIFELKTQLDILEARYRTRQEEMDATDESSERHWEAVKIAAQLQRQLRVIEDKILRLRSA
jgi:hypothetical protein